MLVSNLGVAKIFRFLNLFFYTIGNRNNEKLDQFTPLDIDVKHALARIMFLYVENASIGELNG